MALKWNHIVRKVSGIQLRFTFFKNLLTAFKQRKNLRKNLNFVELLTIFKLIQSETALMPTISKL